MAMRTYFLAFLLLPVAVAYASRNSPLDGIYFIWQFAQVPYLATVVLLAVFIWRAKTHSQILLLTFLAPVLMSFLELVFMVIIDPPELRSMSRVFQLFGSVVPMTVIVSFIFVALSWAFFAVARKLRWVKALP
jgi:hypothetical protein